MQLTDRVKKILLSPKTEWGVISGETETPRSLLTKYVIPLAFIPAAALFTGIWLIGIDTGVFRITGIRWALVLGIINFCAALAGYYASAFIIEALAPNFESDKNIGKSAQLVAYASTAVWVAGICYIIPALSILNIVGLYGFYLFYLGIPVLKKTPDDKRIAYMIVSAIVIIVVDILAEKIISTVIFQFTGNPYYVFGASLHDMRWR